MMLCSHSRHFGHQSIGALFLTYNIGFSAALKHLRAHFKSLQNTWEAISSNQETEMNRNGLLSVHDHSEIMRHFEIPKPTNASEYDGGSWEARFKKPLELPHVLLLPLTSYIHRKANGKTVRLPGLKADVVDKRRDSFAIHSKTFDGVCRNNKCWPFVIKQR